MRGLVFFCLVLAQVVLYAEPAAERQTIRLVATTSLQSSGLLDYLLPEFSAAHGNYDVHLSVVGSGRALGMARRGEVDAVWVHYPEAEKQLLQDGFAAQRHTIVYNDFVLAGPDSDPAGIRGSSNILNALQRLQQQKYPFVSRGDDSGTHQKEMSLWRKLDTDPYGEAWYLETGAGMAATLTFAEQKNAYLLIDRATFIVRGQHGYAILLEDANHLDNAYSVLTVNPERFDNINTDGAQQLIDWLMSEQARQLISDYRKNGVPLYRLAEG